MLKRTLTLLAAVAIAALGATAASAAPPAPDGHCVYDLTPDWCTGT